MADDRASHGWRLIAPYIVQQPASFRLADCDPADTQGLHLSKTEARKLLKRDVAILSELQEMLYAQDSWALLIVFQGIDAAGKDGAIKHVMSGLNPQGVDVSPFKQPTSTELNHDYLWRSHLAMPQRGRIGIFNRSYYEEVLVVRVHPEVLQNEKLPAGLTHDDVWAKRYDDINAFERYLTSNGVAICKFFLHLSKAEQRRRFLKRLDDADRQWKFSPADVRERAYWDDYQRAFQEMIERTSMPYAPWYVVPADHKWFSRYVVAAALIHTLRSLKLAYPQVDEATRRELQAARALLEET